MPATSGAMPQNALKSRLCDNKARPFHARFEVLRVDAEGSARRSGRRQPEADAPRGHDQEARQRPLHVDAAWPDHAAQGRAHRSRGNESRGRARSRDAGDPARRAVAGDRSLGKDGPAHAALKDRQERDFVVGPTHEEVDHRHRAPGDPQLQAAAGQLLPDPDQVPRRDPAALRRDARRANSS